MSILKYSDTAIEILISLLVIFTPLAFGTVHIWSITILEISIFCLLIIWILRYFLQSKSDFYIEIHIPFILPNFVFLLFICFVFIQMVPFSIKIIKIFSPNRYHLYKMTLPLYDGPYSISICIHQTILEIIKIISYIGIFFLAVSIFNSKTKIKRIVIVMFTAGIIEAFLGIFQMLSKTNKIFWFWQSVYKKGGYFGSFVNPNHFAAYMDMIICIGIGLLISRPKIPFYPSKESWRHYLYKFESYISKNVLLIFLISIMGASVFLSLSRGGILCFLLLLLLFFIFQGTKTFKGKRVIIVITAIILAFLIWIGIDPVIKELSTLLNLKRASPQRPIAWKEALRIIKDYPFIGVGLGNFRNIFPLYKSPELKSFWDHAHNEYLEYLVDTGVIGFILFYLAIFWCLFIIVKRWYQRSERFCVGIGLGGMVAIFSLLMDNMVTFNLHIPAISFIFFLILGITVRTVFLYHHAPVKKIVLKKKKAVFILGFICLIFVFIINYQMDIFKADRMFTEYKKTKDFGLLKTAIKLDPTNAGYYYALAQEYFKDTNIHGYEALKLCMSAVRLNPTNPWYHIGLAWIAYKLDYKFVCPKKELALALRLDPTNPYIKKYLKKWDIHANF